MPASTAPTRTPTGNLLYVAVSLSRQPQVHLRSKSTRPSCALEVQLPSLSWPPQPIRALHPQRATHTNRLSPASTHPHRNGYLSARADSATLSLHPTIIRSPRGPTQDTCP